MIAVAFVGVGGHNVGKHVLPSQEGLHRGGLLLH